MFILKRSRCSSVLRASIVTLLLLLPLVSCAPTTGPSPRVSVPRPAAAPPRPMVLVNPLLLLTGEEVLLDGKRVGDKEDLEVLRDTFRGGPPSALASPLAQRARDDQRARKGKARLTLCLTSEVDASMIWGAIYTTMEAGFKEVTLAVRAPEYGAACALLALYHESGADVKPPLAMVVVDSEQTVVIRGKDRIEGPVEGRLVWIKEQLAAHPRTGRVHIVGDERPFGEVAALVRHLHKLGFTRLHLTDAQGMTFPHERPSGRGVIPIGKGSLASIFGTDQQIGEAHGLGELGLNAPEDQGTIGLGALGSHRDTPPRPGRIRLGQPRVKGGIAVELVAQGAARLRGPIRSCYQRRLKKRARLAGQLQIDFTIDARGRVSQVFISEDKVQDAPVKACVKAAYARGRFPRPGDQQVVKVSQQVTFSLQ